MHPTLVDVVILGQQLLIKTYGFFMGLAAIAVLVLSFHYVRIFKLPFYRSFICLTAMAIAVPIGARILNILINPAYYASHPGRAAALEIAGFSLMGGLLAAALTGIITACLLKISLWPLADAVAPGLGIGLALMRAGCFLNGCCYGLPSKLPWAVKFPYGSPAHKYYLVQNQATDSGFSLTQLLGSPTLHPTQLYELFAALVAAGLAIYLIKKNASSGVPFLVAAIVFTAARLGIHFLRVQPVTNEIFITFYPIIYLVIILALSITLVCKRKHEPDCV